VENRFLSAIRCRTLAFVYKRHGPPTLATPGLLGFLFILCYDEWLNRVDILTTVVLTESVSDLSRLYMGSLKT